MINSNKNNAIYKIVLTGGPCGGKTTALERIKSVFTDKGYTVLVISEVATDLIGGGVAPWSCGNNLDYQEAQVSTQISKELVYEKAARSMTDKDIIIVCDRGVMDNKAYMTDSEFSEIVGGLGYSEDKLLYGYDAVYHLETAATIGAYTTLNNASRHEAPEAAIALDNKIRDAWSRHPNFCYIGNDGTFDEKIKTLIRNIDTLVSSPKDELQREVKSSVLAIGRWMPIHKGHKKFLVSLAHQFDRLVVGIGSCYENGTPRNCIPAVEREVLLRKIFRREGIPDEKIEILPIPDSETFEEWINDVISVCERYNITHFCTGNKEDILDVLEKKNIKLNLEMIDPEANSDVEYHATDVRNAILRGDEEKMSEMIPSEIIELVKKHVSREVISANCGQGRKFIPGKQTVDVVLLTKESDGRSYILTGKRCRYKRDFAGYSALPGSGIFKFENAIDSALRVLRLETGVNCTLIDKTAWPMPAKIENGTVFNAEFGFVNLFASSDMAINGTMGGASQCFYITVENAKAALEKCFYSRHDLEELKFTEISELPKTELAYDQKIMIYEALEKLGIPCPEECFDVLNEDGTLTGRKVTRAEAHRRGELHGASHICILRENNGDKEMLMQRRSECKDSFPGCYDISSAGHIESGGTFIDTAVKELYEELGIEALPTELTELCDYRISSLDRFHGEIFNNNEICRIYALWRDVDADKLRLQAEEVSEARWFKIKDVKSEIEKKNPLFCTDGDEFMKICEVLGK